MRVEYILEKLDQLTSINETTFVLIDDGPQDEYGDVFGLGVGQDGIYGELHDLGFGAELLGFVFGGGLV